MSKAQGEPIGEGEGEYVNVDIKDGSGPTRPRASRS